MNNSLLFVILIILLVLLALTIRASKSGVAAIAAVGGIAATALGSMDMNNGYDDDTLTYIKGGAAANKVKKDKSASETRANLKPQDGDITIEQIKPLDAKVVANAIEYINAYDVTSFKPLDDDEVKYLTEGVGKTKLPLETLISLRHIVVSQRIANKIAEVIEKSAEIDSEHQAGKTVVEIAKNLTLPPLAVARQILLTSGKTLKEARAILNGEEKSTTALDKQIKEAAALDHASRASMDAIALNNTKLTKKVKSILDKAKISYKTADQLKVEQTNDPELGRPVATPDFFFEAPVKINGTIVNWLDVKNQPLLSADLSPKLVKSMTYLAVKYNRHFGHGAFVFNGVLPGVALETKKGPVSVDIIAME